MSFLNTFRFFKSPSRGIMVYRRCWLCTARNCTRKVCQIFPALFSVQKHPALHRKRVFHLELSHLFRANYSIMLLIFQCWHYSNKFNSVTCRLSDFPILISVPDSLLILIPCIDKCFDDSFRKCAEHPVYPVHHFSHFPVRFLLCPVKFLFQPPVLNA